VTLGGIDALVGVLRDELRGRGRAGNPHQQVRLGQAFMAQETASLWVGKAGRIAEAGLGEAGMIAGYVNLARMAVERAALEVIGLTQRSLGLGAFVQGHPAERLMRDLGTYLRQPAPDETLTEAAAWFTANGLPA
jgi:alkylation response protein AidB-like acyl-CoA dehydrogenase